MSKENKFENFDLEETKVNFDMDKMFNEEVVENSTEFSNTTHIDEPWDYHFEDEEEQDESSRTVKLHPKNTSLYTKIIFAVVVLLALAALLWLGAKALKIIPGSSDKAQSVTVPVVQKLTIQSTESVSETTQETTQAETISTLIETNQTTTLGQTTTRATVGSAAVANGGTSYTVKSGDSLYSIAKAHKVTVAALQSANGSAANNLQPGQTLTIPSSSSASTSNTTSTATASTTTSSAATHTVKAGDTLYAIATKNGLTVAQLKALNGLSSNNVAIGTVLKLK